MRVFLVQTARGLSPPSGGYKANLCLLRYLASRGHTVRQLCYSCCDEVETYVQTKIQSSGRDLQVLQRLLHFRAENGRAGTDVKVETLIMDDGVEFMALEGEAFDAAFGGEENMHNEMAREIADYIEVFEPIILRYCSFCIAYTWCSDPHFK
jgi:hypothetical protein